MGVLKIECAENAENVLRHLWMTLVILRIAYTPPEKNEFLVTIMLLLITLKRLPNFHFLLE